MYKFILSSNKINNYLKGHLKEICFIGRSNVGKSTLINSITNQKKLSRVSNTPGRTRHINFFQDEKKRTLVDLPGYGYSKMSKKEKLEIIIMIENYFQFRKELIKTMLLIDLKIGPTKDDLLMIDFLKKQNRQFFIILTKSDKANQSKMHNTILKIEKITKNYIIISSLKGKNIDKLKKIINLFFNSKERQQ
jgi:GTP-binding protein